jgi:hypothetical protein
MTADFWSGAGGPIASAAVGLVGLPFQIASQRRQQDIMRSGLEAQLRAQNAALETNAMLSREGMYGQLGESTAARNFGQIAADLDFARQQRAKELELGPFAEKQLAFDTDRARRQFDLASSAQAREVGQRANKQALEDKMAGYLAAGRGMFGPIAPVNVGTMFT